MWYSLFGAKYGNKLCNVETAFITSSITNDEILKDAKEALKKEIDYWYESDKYEKSYFLSLLEKEHIHLKHLTTEQEIKEFFSEVSWLYSYPWGELSVEDIPLTKRINSKSLLKLNYKRWLK